MLGAPFPNPHMIAPHHRTTDTALASFLLSQGAVLASGQRLTPKKVEFRFVADRRLHGLLRLYWSKEPVLLVPSRLMEAHRCLKSRSLIRPETRSGAISNVAATMELNSAVTPRK